MNQLLMTKDVAMEYLSLGEEAFDKFITPHVTTSRLDGLVLYLQHPSNECIFGLIT